MITSKKNIPDVRQTQELGMDLAKKVLSLQKTDKALVIFLQGDLGSGKTTFMQGFAKGLGVTEKVLSPTFVIMKRFAIAHDHFKNLYHIDFYRMSDNARSDDLELGAIARDPGNIIAIEWPEKTEKIVGKPDITIAFNYAENEAREITISTELMI